MARDRAIREVYEEADHCFESDAVDIAKFQHGKFQNVVKTDEQAIKDSIGGPSSTSVVDEVCSAL